MIKIKKKKIKSGNWRKTANVLSKIPIKNAVEDPKNFYITLNKVVSEMSLDQKYIDNYYSLKNNKEDIKMRKIINYFLGTGLAIRNSKIFPKKLTKEIKITKFYKNPKTKIEIEKIEKRRIKELKKIYDLKKLITKK